MYIPELGPLTPQKSNVLTRAIGRFLLSGLRWQVKGKVHNTPKLVMVLAPHTSECDFIIALASMLAVGFRSSWLIAAKHTWWPLGIFMRRLGGIPVHRSAPHEVVSQIVKTFNDNDRLLLALSPEGTRKKVARWKTGFWHIAALAGVPIQLVSFDYARRITECGPVIETSNNIEADMKLIQNYYKGVQAKYPSKFGGEYL
jgi:1-acyl-sn-glycerol-3-phosphate acyltransferase